MITLQLHWNELISHNAFFLFAISYTYPFEIGQSKIRLGRVSINIINTEFAIILYGKRELMEIFTNTFNLFQRTKNKMKT